MTQAAVANVEAREINSGSFNFSLVEKWRSFLQVSASTLKAYLKGIKRLQEYMTANQIITPARADLVAYRDYLGSQYQPTTANLYVSAVKGFFAFLADEEYIDKNPCENIKGFKISDTHKKSALSVEMTKAVINKIDSSTLQGLRNKSMYALMTSCGLRCCEIVTANIEDFENVGGVIRLHIKRKGHSEKDLAVTVPAGVYSLILEYLKKRREITPESPLFASCSNRNNGGRLTTNSVSRIIKQILRNGGYDSPRLTAHSLRHSAATVALQNGASLREVQELLSHKNIAVTMIYLHELNSLKNPASNLAARAFGF